MQHSPTELPEPSQDALAHSARLTALLHARIAAAGGWISFADFMRAALYEPGLGYYSAGATKFGSDGDFVTAPELSPLFSRCVAGQCAEVLQALGGGSVLEPGAGTGRMAVDLLTELERVGRLPEQYLILEPSADLRQRQAAQLDALPEALRQRVVWLEQLPDQPFKGVIVANEVLDALPVRRFVLGEDSLAELGIGSEPAAGGEQVFAEQLRPADAAFAASVRDLDIAADPGYCSEYSPELAGWLRAFSDCLDTGLMLLLDYGFSRSEYYMPERRFGTLRCYYRHRAHENALIWPGLQDITAWVDFTAVAEAAVAAGLSVDGYTTQAQFLLASGIDALVETAVAQDPQAQVELARGLRQLLLPGEMGDAIKVMALTKNFAALPSGMTGRDMRASL